MAFGCMSIIGNASLVKSEVKWDCIDDADLTAEQVADLALDFVDNEALAGMEPVDLSIIGELRLDSIDHILADITDLTGGIVWGIGKGLLGDLGDMDFDAIKNKQRSGGDLNVINALLQFIADNAGILSKAAYGMSGGDGIDLGLISSFMDLDDLLGAGGEEMLQNIPLMLTEMVYDMLIYGSYGYENEVTSLPSPMNTLDGIVNNALLNLLINPQDYEWEGEGDAAVFLKLITGVAPKFPITSTLSFPQSYIGVLKYGGKTL